MAMGTPDTVRFQAHLQRGGLGLPEMIRLLEAYAKIRDWDSVRRQAMRGNLLAKTSDYQVKDLLAAFRRRFLAPLGLPPVGLVASMIGAPVAEAAKLQVLFPYFILSDPLVERCYRDLVLPRLRDPSPRLSPGEVRAYLERLSSAHPELARWSAALCTRWAQGFGTLLRRFGLMERHPGTKLHRLWLLPEPFAFFWLWLWGDDRSFWEAWNHTLWEILQVPDEEKGRLLSEGATRRWWTYQWAGCIVHFQPAYDTVEAWIRHGLDGRDA